MKFSAVFLKILPPPGWRLPVALVSGMLFGLAIFLFIISNAASYLSDKPETCINCHVMNEQYTSWRHSSHREWANCNDCHVPHDYMVRKYFFKAMDGMRHSTIFTMRAEPQVIRIREPGKKVVLENCIRCHQKLVGNVDLAGLNPEAIGHGAGKFCWECHREVPHGRVSSLSASNSVMNPKLGSPVPVWLQELMNVTVKKNDKK
jgi:cytochrome c nitrite reductase small subunit